MGFYISSFSTLIALGATLFIKADIQASTDELWHPSLKSFTTKTPLITDDVAAKPYVLNNRDEDFEDSKKSLKAVGGVWIETLAIPTVLITALMRFNMEVYFEWEILLIPQHFDSRYGYDSAQIALVTSGIFVTIAIFSPISGILGNKIGNLSVLSLGLLILAFGTTGLGPTYIWDDWLAEKYDIWVECIGTVLVGLGLAMAHAPIGAFLANSVQREVGNARGEVVAGIMSLFMAMGACCGPLIGSGLMDMYGYQNTSFIHACQVFAFLTGVVVLWMFGVVENDLEFLKSRRAEREVPDEKLTRPSSLVPWGGPMFNYVFADVAAYQEQETPRFFSLHTPSAIKPITGRRTMS